MRSGSVVLAVKTADEDAARAPGVASLMEHGARSATSYQPAL